MKRSKHSSRAMRNKKGDPNSKRGNSRYAQKRARNDMMYGPFCANTDNSLRRRHGMK